MDCSTPDPTILQLSVAAIILLLAACGWSSICVYVLTLLKSKFYYVHERYKLLTLQALVWVITTSMPLLAIRVIVS